MTKRRSPLLPWLNEYSVDIDSNIPPVETNVISIINQKNIICIQLYEGGGCSVQGVEVPQHGRKISAATVDMERPLLSQNLSSNRLFSAKKSNQLHVSMSDINIHRGSLT